MPQATPASVVAVFRKPAKGAPMEEPGHCKLIAGAGQEGAVMRGGKRQVTLLDQARWQDTIKDLGADLPPITRRADLLVAGLDLANSKGRKIRLGPTLLLVHGETVPCETMEEACPGLKAAMVPDWRGGIYCEILEGGEVRVGDALSFVDDSA